jgi:hypothetical protein
MSQVIPSVSLCHRLESGQIGVGREISTVGVELTCPIMIDDHLMLVCSLAF